MEGPVCPWDGDSFQWGQHGRVLRPVVTKSKKAEPAVRESIPIALSEYTEFSGLDLDRYTDYSPFDDEETYNLEGYEKIGIGISNFASVHEFQADTGEYCLVCERHIQLMSDETTVEVEIPIISPLYVWGPLGWYGLVQIPESWSTLKQPGLITVADLTHPTAVLTGWRERQRVSGYYYYAGFPSGDAAVVLFELPPE